MIKQRDMRITEAQGGGSWYGGGSTIELITDVGIATRGADLSWSVGRYRGMHTT